MSSNCNHKWVDMEDGTNDKFCVRCSKKAMQAVNYMPTINVEVNVGCTEPSIDTITKQIEKKINNKIKYYPNKIY